MEQNQTEALLRMSMEQPEDFVAVILYLDAKANVTERTISPIRYLTPRRLLGYCLGRQELRTFHLSRILRTRIRVASDVLAPEAIKEIVIHHRRNSSQTSQQKRQHGSRRASPQD